MLDVQSLKDQIKHNCNISDATYWGYYSICGLLMRLRELYRSEHQMMPWDRINNTDISPWIEQRERLWQELDGRDFGKLNIDSVEIDPFDADIIQKSISEYNLVYGAGYSFFGKPTFFLAEAEGFEKLNGYSVYYTFRELCRDLSSHPAMQKANTIYIRREPLLAKLWSKFLELKGRRFGGALKEAFSSYGLGGDTSLPVVKDTLIRISYEITDILVYHEIAEAKESFEIQVWLKILSRCNDLKVEFYLRTLKDIIADTSPHGPLKRIINEEDERLLNFYIILSERVHRTVAPEIINAYQTFKTHKDWKRFDEIRYTVYQKLSNAYNKIITVWRDTEDHGEVSRLIENINNRIH